jgi:hypothetical protein
MSNTVNVSTTTNQVVITPQSTKTVSINPGGDTSITVNQGGSNTVNISNNVVNTSLTPTTVDINIPPSNGITVTDLRKTITVNQGITSTVQVATIGPQGPKGNKGDTGEQGPTGPVQDTGSLLKNASYTNPLLTFTRGDNTDFSVEISTTTPTLAEVTAQGSSTTTAITASIISSSGTIFMDRAQVYGKAIINGDITASNDLMFDGSHAIRTLGGSDDLDITPQRNLNLGTTSTDNITIGRTDSWPGVIKMHTATGNSLVITGSKIGIRTTNPNEALEVIGNISASGTITGNIGSFTSVSGFISGDSANRILTTDGDGTLTAESSLTLNGGTLVGDFAGFSARSQGGFSFDDSIITINNVVIDGPNGHITASGNISASGDLQGNQLNITKNIPKLVLNTNTSNLYSQIDGTSGSVRIDVDNGNQAGNSTFGVRIDTAGTNQLSLNSDGELTLTGGITASGNISSSGTILGENLDINGPSNSHIEVGTYNVGYDTAPVDNLYVTGSGLIVSGAMADTNHHNFIKIGDTEIVDVKNAARSAFLIHNVDEFVVATGSDGGNLFGAGQKLIEHTGDDFRVFSAGTTIFNFLKSTNTLQFGVNGGTTSLNGNSSINGTFSIIAANTTENYTSTRHIAVFDTNPNTAAQEVESLPVDTFFSTVTGAVTASAVSASGDLIGNTLTVSNGINHTGFYFTPVTEVSHSGGSIYNVGTTEYIIFNKFTGSSDPGNPALIYLPPTANNEGRQLRFLTSSSLANNSKEIHIYPNTGDSSALIDDSSYFELERPFDGVTLICHSSSWYIVQRKSK